MNIPREALRRLGWSFIGTRGESLERIARAKVEVLKGLRESVTEYAAMVAAVEAATDGQLLAALMAKAKKQYGTTSEDEGDD